MCSLYLLVFVAKAGFDSFSAQINKYLILQAFGTKYARQTAL
jgi:hypothetical protein